LGETSQQLIVWSLRKVKGLEGDPLGLLCERCLEGELRRGGGTAVQLRPENAGKTREKVALLARIRMFDDSPRGMGAYRRLFEFRWDKDVRDVGVEEEEEKEEDD
jgi:hypothetical protein